MSTTKELSEQSVSPIPQFSEAYLTTKEFAHLLKTNPSVIKASRSSNVLFNRKPPLHIRFSERKILYKLSVVQAWIDSFPTSSLTTQQESPQLAEAREGAQS